MPLHLVPYAIALIAFAFARRRLRRDKEGLDGSPTIDHNARMDMTQPPMLNPNEQFISLATPAQRIGDDEAKHVAKTHYGLDGEVKRFDTEKDDTFRLSTRDGQTYLLKIANAADDPDGIAFQIDLLAHIHRKNPSLPIPAVLPARDGRLQFPYISRAGERRETHMLTYLDGVPLSEVESNADQRRQIGAALGTLRHATAGFSHPSENRVIAWDVKHLPALAPLLSEIEDEAGRKMLQAGLDRFASIRGQLAKLRTQVLHNDFSRSNVIVDPAKSNFVTGIIDFGDATRTAVAIDVSTAVLNLLPSQETDDFFAPPIDIVRGYLSTADLTDEELRLIPHLAMGRVVGRTMLTYWRGRLFPDNAKYITRNTQQGWYQLSWFMARPMDQISDMFITAARQ